MTQQPDPYQEKLDGLIAGLREFADWLNDHRYDGLELPPMPDFTWSTQFAGDGAEALAGIAAAFNTEVLDVGTQLWMNHLFGADPDHGLRIHAYHIKPEVADADEGTDGGDPR